MKFGYTLLVTESVSEMGCCYMKMEIKPDSHPTQALSCYVANIAEYRCETIDGKRYIIGTKRNEDKQLFTFEKLESTSLLHSLLLLYESLDIHGSAMRPDKYDTQVTPGDTDRIIAWCVEHGLPFEENSLWMKYHRIGFQIAAFYSRLDDLYTCYLLWRVLYLKDTNSENYYVHKQVSVEKCRGFLQTRMITLDVRYVPDFSVEPPSFNIVCPDIMEIAKTQMFIECTVADYNFTMGICEVCGSVYVKTRKNNTQCPECQKTKVQRLRAKQRLEKQQKEGEQ